MLLFFLLFASVSPAAIETRMLECAKALSKAHRWVVPLAGNQTHYADLYDHERDLFHVWSQEKPQTLYFYSDEKLYVADMPRPYIAPQMVNWNRVVIRGLPGGDDFLEYNASGTQHDLHRYHSLSKGEREKFSKEVTAVRPATAEEEKEAFALFLDRMGYLWKMRESVENPSWMSHISNLGKGTRPPTAAEMQQVKEACAIFFSPDAELNCRK